MANRGLSIALKETTKTISKSPGWVPLTILCYLVIQRVDLPAWLSDNFDLTVGVVVFVLYLLGDIVDKYIFPRKVGGVNSGWEWITNKVEIDKARNVAQNSIKVEIGIYNVSKLISVAKGGRQLNIMRVKNESAKFFRSLIVPFVILGFWSVAWGSFVLGVISLSCGLIMTKLYGTLKGGHMSDLYLMVPSLVGDSKYTTALVNSKVRFHFWDGKLIVTSNID